MVFLHNEVDVSPKSLKSYKSTERLCEFVANMNQTSLWASWVKAYREFPV
jgi:hypothetical protein